MLRIDGNENMSDSKMQRVLQRTGLIELSSMFSNEPLFASHTSGSKQIDAVWPTPNKIQIILAFYLTILQLENTDALLWISQ